MADPACKAGFGHSFGLQSLNSSNMWSKHTLAKAIIVEDHQFEHAVKVARVTGRNRARDVALLHVLFGTALTPTEISLLRVDDYLNQDGTVKRDWIVREDIAYNRRERPLFWVNKKVVTSLDSYLEHRRTNGLGTMTSTAYRGLQPESAIFLTEDGRSMAMTKRMVNGKPSYACDVLTSLYKKLFSQAGIEGASATSGRRTFATKLYRRHQRGEAGGGDLRHIQELLGHTSIKAVRKLVECDPANLGAIVAKII